MSGLLDLLAPFAAKLVFAALALFVVITAVRGRPRRGFTNTEYPPPFGARLIVWISLGLWALLILPALDLAIYWLAALFALGPVYTLWRWPETVAIDELRIHQSAWCHRDVSILWQDVESIKLSNAGDSVVLRGRNGEAIGVSASQVGAQELMAEISRRSGLECPACVPIAP
jgi:hypothetical protein